MKFYTLNTILLIKLIYSFSFPCSDPCSTCQNTLYYLKLEDRFDCRFTQCPEICLQISRDYSTKTNEHIIMFQNNLISICEVCFRLELCHISKCEVQRRIMKNIIKNSIRSQIDLHKIFTDTRIEQEIHNTLKDFYFNTELILTNLHRTLSELGEYVTLSEQSFILKKVYFLLSSKDTNSLMEKDNFMQRIELMLKDYTDCLGTYKNFKEKYSVNSMPIVESNKTIIVELLRLQNCIETIVKTSNSLLEKIETNVANNLQMFDTISYGNDIYQGSELNAISNVIYSIPNNIKPNLSDDSNTSTRMKEVVVTISPNENFDRTLPNDSNIDSSNYQHSTIDDFIKRRNELIINDSLVKKIDLHNLINASKEGDKIIKESYDLSKIKEEDQETSILPWERNNLLRNDHQHKVEEWRQKTKNKFGN